jgi:SAM-dependent methyltransferase
MPTRHAVESASREARSRKRVGLPNGDRGQPGRSKLFYAENNPDSRHSGRERWEQVRRIGDFRPTDQVLDIGCAEGWITLEVARLVQHVDGFDISQYHVAEAQRMAAEQGLANAAFEAVSIDDYAFEPLSYDVVLLLSVFGRRLGETRTIGAANLDRVLAATRRQLLMGVGIEGKGYKGARLEVILEACERAGFDSLCFSDPRYRNRRVMGNIILAHRRGTDARAGELPARVVVPTTRLGDHPVVRSASAVASHDSDNSGRA